MHGKVTHESRDRNLILSIARLHYISALRGFEAYSMNVDSDAVDLCSLLCYSDLVDHARLPARLKSQDGR